MRGANRKCRAFRSDKLTAFRANAASIIFSCTELVHILPEGQLSFDVLATCTHLISELDNTERQLRRIYQ
jgi:aspartate/glutamate racemase